MATRDQQEAQETKEPEQVENNQDNYVWCNQMTERPNMPVSLSYDLEDIGDVAEHVLKSTIYSALGAVLYSGSAMTVWIDWDHRAMDDISMYDISAYDTFAYAYTNLHTEHVIQDIWYVAYNVKYILTRNAYIHE